MESLNKNNRMSWNDLINNMKTLLNYNNLNENKPGSGAFASYANDSGDVFWGNVGGGCFCVSLNTKRILLPFRSAEVNEPHCWGIIGGKLDEDVQSEIETAVMREFDEETGYKGDIHLIPTYVFKTPSGSFVYHNFIGLIHDEFEPTLNWETEKFKWVTFDELMKIKPKHFGLINLLKDEKSLEIIKKYTL